MAVKYKHDAIVRAWLDGKTVERREGERWVTLPEVQGHPYVPTFGTDSTYRIKPEDRIVTFILYRSKIGVEYASFREGAIPRSVLEDELSVGSTTLVTSYQVRIPQ